MADIVSSEKRSRMMSAIKGTDTKPEIVIRKGLYAAGFRYRLHTKGLAGRPDIVLPKFRAVIFVNGCFWHGHGCALFKWPKTRVAFWRNKISSTIARDQKAAAELRATGWRVATVWECALKGRDKLLVEDVISGCADWLRSNEVELEIKGATDGNR